MEKFYAVSFFRFFSFLLHYAHNPLFQKVPEKSPPRKSKMDIFKMSKMEIFRILFQQLFILLEFFCQEWFLWQYF
jgi:hypothetical protein